MIALRIVRCDLREAEPVQISGILVIVLGFCSSGKCGCPQWLGSIANVGLGSQFLLRDKKGLFGYSIDTFNCKMGQGNSE